MPSNTPKVARLAEEIRRLTEEIGARERRLRGVVTELNGLLGPESTPSRSSSHAKVTLRSVRSTPDDQRALTDRVVEFLAIGGDRSFLPRQIAHGLNLPREKKKSLNTTLYLLGRKGRIRKTEAGWSGPGVSRALAIGCALLTMSVFFTACSGSSTTTSSSSTTGVQTSTSTTGHRYVNSSVSTGSWGSGSSTSGGTTTGGTTTGGSTTGTSTTGTTTSSTTSSSTSGTTGTTGYPAGPPYQGFDSGFPPQPSIDQGCTAAAPFRNQQGYCVGCRTKNDCATGLQCDDTQQCVVCRSAADCATGQVCNRSCFNIQVEPYYTCDVSCQTDCRSPSAGPTFCNPGACDGDAGGCLTNECYQNSDCVVNGRGACDFRDVQYYGYGNCVACTTDAGGCGPGELCTYDSNTGNDICQLSCLLDAGVCGNGTYCTDAGTCTGGCQTSEDCIGSSSGNICNQGQCVGCLTNATCPDYNAGCNPMYPQDSNQSATCGYCTTDQDCSGGGGQQHCETNKGYSGYGMQCGCHADSECPLDAPVCVGLNAALGFPAGSGRCACTDSSQCPNSQGVQFICETRYPFTITNGSYGPAIGGACIAPCNVDLSGTDLVGTNCATAGIGGAQPNTYYQYGPPPADNVCNSSTGFCVPCAEDSDCFVPASGPAVAPHCVSYPNGLDPSSGEPTGGGLCGCDNTSQCNDGWACWAPGIGGYCQAPCTVTGGIDSCNPYRADIYYSPPVDPFCDTWTGACVQCLDSYGCTNVVVTQVDGKYAYPGFAAPNCNSTGQCVGCSSDSDCPSSAPNCTQGFCGFCTNSSQCYQDAGFTCMFFNGTGNAGTCTITGCVGDSNENATDAGTICPPDFPYCPETEICTNQCTFPTICAQCRPDYYPPTYEYWGDCNNNLPPGAYEGYCRNNGICQYYYN
jgi:hypothetical protein